jgi:hypothetical protein
MQARAPCFPANEHAPAIGYNYGLATAVAGIRTDDTSTTALLHHLLGRRSVAQEHAERIDVHHFLPLFDSGLVFVCSVTGSCYAIEGSSAHCQAKVGEG